MTVLAIDVGGANLKCADGRGYAASRYFPLWRTPDELPGALTELIAAAPHSERVVATMTGELADCFRTKRDGVEAIAAALHRAAGSREIQIYLTDGSLVPPAGAVRNPLAAAASNWHALASYAGRLVPQGGGLLVDIGSTTSDLIPLSGGAPVALGKTDPERLVHGELVYTGVERSPICAVVTALPWRGRQCPTAQEVFATTLDAYVMLGDRQDAQTATADGRPATPEFARDRLARSICADRDLFSEEDALAAARAVEDAQLARLGVACRGVLARLPSPLAGVVLSGEGEFLAARLLERLEFSGPVVSLTERLGPVVSRCATAHALAVLAANGTGA